MIKGEVVVQVVDSKQFIGVTDKGELRLYGRKSQWTRFEFLIGDDPSVSIKHVKSGLFLHVEKNGHDRLRVSFEGVSGRSRFNLHSILTSQKYTLESREFPGFYLKCESGRLVFSKKMVLNDSAFVFKITSLKASLKKSSKETGSASNSEIEDENPITSLALPNNNTKFDDDIERILEMDSQRQKERIDELENQLGNLSHNLSLSKSDNEDLRRKFSQMSAEANLLKSKLESEKQDNFVLKRNIQDSANTNSRLELEISSLRNSLVDSQNACNRFQSSISEMNSKISQDVFLQEKLNDSMAQRDKLSIEIETLNLEIGESVRGFSELANAYNILSQEHNGLKEKCSETSEILNKKQIELDSADLLVNSISDEKSKLKIELEKMTNNFARHEAESTTLRERVEEVQKQKLEILGISEKSKKILEDALQCSKAENQFLQKFLIDKTEERDLMNEELSLARADLDKRKDDELFLKNHISRLSKDFENANQEIDQIKLETNQSIQILTSKISDLENENLQVSTNFEFCKNQVVIKDNELANFKSIIQELKVKLEDFQDLQIKFADLKKIQEKSEKERDSLKLEISSVRQQLTQDERQYSLNISELQELHKKQMEIQAKTVDSQNISLKNQFDAKLEIAEKVFRDLEISYGELSRESKKQQTQLDEKHSLLKEKDKEFFDLKAKFQHYEKRIHILEKNLEKEASFRFDEVFKLRKENDDLRHRLLSSEDSTNQRNKNYKFPASSATLSAPVMDSTISSPFIAIKDPVPPPPSSSSSSLLQKHVSSASACSSSASSYQVKKFPEHNSNLHLLAECTYETLGANHVARMWMYALKDKPIAWKKALQFIGLSTDLLESENINHTNSNSSKLYLYRLAGVDLICKCMGQSLIVGVKDESLKNLITNFSIQDIFELERFKLLIQQYQDPSDPTISLASTPRQKKQQQPNSFTPTSLKRRKSRLSLTPPTPKVKGTNLIGKMVDLFGSK